MIIQMQDTTINTSNTSSYGAASAINAGKYEYAVVASVAGSTVTLTSGLTNSYTYQAGSDTVVQKTIQLIRVPVYSSASLGAGTTALAWNGSTGGVLAFDVTGALNLNSVTVDVRGKGYRGGGGRQLGGGTGINTDYRTLATNNANGSKGEGIAGTPRYVNNSGSLLNTGVEGYPNGSYARGAPANAGGGGTDDNPPSNDENTGGGGGGGYGSGGLGGYGWNATTSPGRGIGGAGVASSASKLTMGGGGGAGTSNNGTGTPGSGFASSGAIGGGVIMVRAGSMTGTGTFNVSGANANNTVTNDGSGGGGGAGTVLAYAGSGLTGLTVVANGGTGGTNTGGGSDHGPGGGGGGGYVLSSGALAACSVSGGANGTTYAGHSFGATSGSVGSCATSLTSGQIVGAALGQGPCASAGFNHLRIEHAGSGVTCAPTTLTIKACTDALCTSLYAGGVTGTLTATGTPTVNWVGGASFAIGATGLATKDVQVTTAGTVAWGASGVATVASNGTTCYVGATNSCSFTSDLAGFLFDVPHHASDTSQTITVSAVKQADNSLACTPAFASTSKTINFGCGFSNPATGTLPVVVGGSNITCGSTSGIALNFNASGVASTTVRYADVGQMSLTASYTGSSGSEAGLVMNGSDTFIAAPASLLVTPAGPYVAGNSFSVTVAAKNASGNTTPNFGKESTTENVTLGHTLTGPAGGNDPALTGTTTMPDASFQSGNGTATVSDIKWAEVGDISITATLASASYLGSGLTATGSTAAGAFKPAYFDTVVTPGTGSLTYSGQPFAVQVTAKNASGGTTLNYKGAYAKAVTLSDGNSGTNNSATLGTFSNASIAAASFTNGVATTSTVSYRFNTKTTAPLETPTSAPLKLRATDTDGVTSNGHTEGTTPIRAGRLRLVNFYGSDLLKPRIEYRAEYWDGSRWATNTLDSSSPIVAGNIATGGLAVSSLTALNAGLGFITFNTAAVGSYDIALDLNAAGVDTSCNAAHGGTAANKPWLQGYWSAPANCGGVAAWAQDPNARVRLGSPRAPYIYLRERY